MLRHPRLDGCSGYGPSSHYSAVASRSKECEAPQARGAGACDGLPSRASKAASSRPMALMPSATARISWPHRIGASVRNSSPIISANHSNLVTCIACPKPDPRAFGLNIDSNLDLYLRPRRARIADRAATGGRRAHQTCKRFGAGNGVMGVRSRVLSIPSSAIGSQRSMRRISVKGLNPLWGFFYKYSFGQCAEV